MILKPRYIFVLILILAGCSKPRIDTSTEQSTKDSIGKVKKSLPAEKHEEFEKALQFIMYTKFNFGEFLLSSKVDTGAYERKVKEILDGKTGQEILDLAQNLKQELDAKEEQERKVDEQNRLEEEQDRLVSSIIQDGNHLLRIGSLPEAKAKFELALNHDSSSIKAQEGLNKVLLEIETLKEQNDYIKSVKIYDLESDVIDTLFDKQKPALRFKIKNEGQRTLREVRVKVSFGDSTNNVIHVDHLRPLIHSPELLIPSSEPLEPGHIWQLEDGKWFMPKNVPSEWVVGKVKAEVVSLKLGMRSKRVQIDYSASEKSSPTQITNDSPQNLQIPEDVEEFFNEHKKGVIDNGVTQENAELKEDNVLGNKMSQLANEAKNAVKQRLEHPDSAKFQDLRFLSTSKYGDVIIGQVNSKNSLDSYQGFQKFISDGKTTILETETDNFARLYQKLIQGD